jgi:hypothetical protein
MFLRRRVRASSGECFTAAIAIASGIHRSVTFAVMTAASATIESARIDLGSSEIARSASRRMDAFESWML